MRCQAWQGGVDHAGADQHREPGIAQLVMQGRECQFIEELVEQRGAGRVERVVASPSRQLLDQLFLFVTFGHCTQGCQERGKGARAIVTGGVQLQCLAVLGVPFHLWVGQVTIKLAATVGQVVVTRYWHRRRWLVVGRNDIAARGVFLLRVDAEGVETELVGLRIGAVEDERRVDAVGADWQLCRCPPTDIATGIGPDKVEPGRVNLGGGLAHLAQGVGAVELVEAVEDRVFSFQKCPPHGDWRGAGGITQHVVDDRAVGRAAQADGDRLLAFDGNLLFGRFQCVPLAIDHHLIGVGGVGLFGDQVNVIVLEHGQAPAKVTVVAEQGERVECLEIAVEVEAGR